MTESELERIDAGVARCLAATRKLRELLGLDEDWRTRPPLDILGRMR